MTENEMIRNAMPVCLHPLNNKYRAIIKKALEEIQQYRAIGTVEECRVAVEKHKEVRNKAIDDLRTEICKTIVQSERNGNYRFYAVEIKQLIADLGEQLKGGGVNE